MRDFSRRLMKTGAPFALLLAFSVTPLSGDDLWHLHPDGGDYPSPKNDPNGLWKKTSDAFWNVPPPPAADPSEPPPGLTPSQRQKWYDKAALIGTVLKNTGQGLLVKCPLDMAVRDSSRTDPTLAPISLELGAPRVYGIFLLRNYPRADKLAEGDEVKTVAFPGGRYKDGEGNVRRIYDADIRDY
jgi:hypothetical protein